MRLGLSCLGPCWGRWFVAFRDLLLVTYSAGTQQLVDAVGYVSSRENTVHHEPNT